MSIAHDIGEYLEDQSIGTVGTDMFINELSSTTGNCIGVYDGPGNFEDSVNVSDGSVEIIVRNSSQATAHTKIDSIITALNYVHKTTIESHSYLYIKCTQTPFPLGRDENNNYKVKTSFRVVRAY